MVGIRMLGWGEEGIAEVFWRRIEVTFWKVVALLEISGY